MISAAYKHALEHVDYREIISGIHAPKSPLESYVAVRGAIVMGEFELAHAYLESLAKQATSQSHHIFQLAQTALRIFLRDNLDAQIEQLIGLTLACQEHVYLLGEVHFLLGYAHNVSDRFHHGLPHFRVATRCYQDYGLWALATIAQFNVCVSVNHLGRLNDLQPEIAAMDRFVERAQRPVATFHAQRFHLYLQINRCEFASSSELALDLLRQSRSLGRWRDFSALLAVAGYVCVKCRQADILSELINNHADVWSKVATEEVVIFREFRDIANRTIIDSPSALDMERRWRLRSIDSVHRFHLIDCLLDLLSNAEEWETVASLSERAHQDSLRQQQGSHLVDFTFHRLRALLATGQYMRAERLNASYLQRARQVDSTIMVQRAEKIRIELQSRRANSQTGSMPLVSDPRIIFDPEQKLLMVGYERIPLGTQPTLLRAFGVLAGTAKPMEVGDFFSAVYDQDYHPLRHERRLGGLIDRMRRIVPGSRWLRREGGSVYAQPQILLNRTLDSRQTRQRQLLRILQSSTSPLSMNDLSERFPVSRRMLQLELRVLIKSQQVGVIGAARNRLYRAIQRDD